MVDPLLSDVAESGHLSGLPLVKLIISGSILSCPVTVHFSLFCVFWLVLLTQFHHSVTTWTILPAGLLNAVTISSVVPS